MDEAFLSITYTARQIKSIKFFFTPKTTCWSDKKLLPVLLLGTLSGRCPMVCKYILRPWLINFSYSRNFIAIFRLKKKKKKKQFLKLKM